ncbi:(2Fe-2S)-binding protein [Pseudarthrobacter sp. S9]|uniref:(2Fe-2S)-binding protein n=1 Tax=Pseudarthrobacter sp. S9 TaxID=3418421 RepID=UPI003CFE2B78
MSTPARDTANAPAGAAKRASQPDVVTVSFDGRLLEAAPGQSVGAALVTQGITAWRSTRKGARPRGLFCGIGVCFDCLVTVDGAPNQRACLVEVRGGMQIEGSCPQEQGGRA